MFKQYGIFNSIGKVIIKMKSWKKIIIIGLNIVLMMNTVNISFGAEKSRICSYLFESLEQSEDWKTDITTAGWRQVDGQWYFFNQDGNYLTNTLTPDGYWLDEYGHYNEQKRIYGKCVFNPTNYVKLGNQLLITGNICDTGYAKQQELDNLYSGNIVFTPGLNYSGRVCELNTMQVIDKIVYEDGLRTLVTYASYYDERGELMEHRYYINAQKIYGESTYSMPWPVYRVIQKDVILVADSNTIFSSEKEMYGDEMPMTMESCLENWTAYWPNNDYVWEIELNGNYIHKAVDIGLNYMG